MVISLLHLLPSNTNESVRLITQNFLVRYENYLQYSPKMKCQDKSASTFSHPLDIHKV